MNQHLSGQDFDIMVGDLMLHVEAMNASITDNRKAVMSGGVPNGYVNGDVSCSGELELDTRNFNLFMESAKAAGSFQEIEPFDLLVMGKSLKDEQKLEFFECLPTVTDLVNIDQKGGEKTKHKVPFEVTGSDFVRINGVPYLSENATRNL